MPSPDQNGASSRAGLRMVSSSSVRWWLTAVASSSTASCAHQRLIENALQATGRGLPTSLRQLGAGVALRLGGTWTTLIVAQVETERLGEARASQQQLLKRQPAFTVGNFLDATPLEEDLARRFADRLLSAGAPP